MGGVFVRGGFVISVAREALRSGDRFIRVCVLVYGVERCFLDLVFSE